MMTAHAASSLERSARSSRVYADSGTTTPTNQPCEPAKARKVASQRSPPTVSSPVRSTP